MLILSYGNYGRVIKSGNNYCCGYAHPELGAIIVSGESIKDTQNKFKESLAQHIKCCIDDGDVIPKEFINNDYVIIFE